MYKKTRTVRIGGAGRTNVLEIGGDAPVSVQTMWKEGIRDLSADALSSLLERIDALSALGCDVVRFAVPDMESADSLIRIAEQTSMPLVADIHFDYRLALRCLDN